MIKKILVLMILTAVLMTLAIPLVAQFDAVQADQNLATSQSVKPNLGIGLHLPPFFSVAQAAPPTQNTIADYFASGVAGITAYVNVGKAIDVDKLAESSVFEVIEDRQAGEYVIGTVTASGFKDSNSQRERMQAHVFVEREGWIIAYLTSDETVSNIIDWSAYDTKKLNTTSLEDVIYQVAQIAGVSISKVGYYHFGYPDATNLLLIGDSLTSSGDDFFTVKVPSGLKLYESTFSSAAYKDGTRCYIGDEKLADVYDGYDWTRQIGTIPVSKWTANSPVRISLSASLARGESAYCGVAIIYGTAE